MIINDIQLEQIIEGALMASGQTLSVDRIQSLFDEGLEPDKARILIALERLGEKCEQRGYELKKVATGYRFQVKQDFSKWIGRLWDEKPQRYSRALLETLSIIAYRQPVTRGEIENVRGVAVSSHITKTLVEREWIQVVGHRDVPGRPAMYATTKMFLDYFNLESLDQLPTLEEIAEIADANHALELEEKVQEGNFDFSSQASEEEGNDTLESAAQDLAAADALVQAVEDAVFNKPEEDEEQIELAVDEVEEVKQPSETLSSIELAEAFIADADDEISQQQAVDLVPAADTELSEEALAEATIARMIAEQEALLNEKAGTQGKSGQSNVSVKVGDSQASESVFSAFNNDESDAEGFANLGAQDSEPQAVQSSKPSSVFDDFNSSDIDEPQTDQSTDVIQSEVQGSAVSPTSSTMNEDDDLMAAMEDELMAQLEAEQEALLTEQADQDGDGAAKTLADLASKFE
ncbi:SMC-Scp complex subunit ScpB [Bermanella sp. 47_1433_sub80_T6]|nr:SMC-Scp complex subunit ScpB [Bermanella sp. 47_1433_sub80_T6]